MNKITKKLMAVLLSLILIFSVAVTGQAAEGTTQAAKSYVTFSVERFTVGQGYLVEPTRVEVKDGDTAASVFLELMKSKGITHDGAVNEYGFYLNSINNADSGKIDIPVEISSMPDVSSWGAEYKAPTNDVNDGNELPNKALGSGSYNGMSGWMFMVNNEDKGVAADQIKVKNGDVIRLQFSVYGWGADIGFDTESYTGVKCPKLANKDALSEKVATISSSEKLKDETVKVAYNNALTALATYNISQVDTDSALAALNLAEKTYDEAHKESEQITSKKDEVTTTKKPVQTTKKPLGKTKITGKLSKKSSSKKIKLTFKRVKKAKKYTVQVSTTKKFKKVLYKKTVKKTSVTLSSSKLKNKKKLYVRVRAVGADKWSKVVKVTVKK